MKRVGFLSIWLVGLSLVGGGCSGDSAGRIASLEAAVGHAEKALEIAEGQVAALQAQLAAALAAGADSQTLTRLQAALAEAQAQRPGVEQFLTEARASLARAKENPTVAGEIELYVSMGLSALGIFGTAWFKRKAALQAGTLRAIVKGVEASPAEVAERVKVQIEGKMKDAGVFDTANAIVDAIKG